MESILSRRRFLPGLTVLLIIGALASAITEFTPVSSSLLIALVLGALLSNTIGVPIWAEPGTKSYSFWLEAGIILMGASIAIGQVVNAGSTVLIIVLSTIILTIFSIEILSRIVFSIPEKVGTLLAAGSSICGVSAIVAVAGSINPNGKQIAYAAATILLFDALMILVYPILGNVLGLSDTIFGIWAGATMFSTGPVAVAGFTYSQAAGEWAILVKLTRNALIGVVVVGYTIYYTKNSNEEVHHQNKLVSLWRTFPKFILGFILLMFLSSVGVFTDRQITALTNISNWLFLIAFAGLGLSINFREMQKAGLKPILVTLSSLVFVSTVVLLVLLNTF